MKFIQANIVMVIPMHRASPQLILFRNACKVNRLIIVKNIQAT